MKWELDKITVDMEEPAADKILEAERKKIGFKRFIPWFGALLLGNVSAGVWAHFAEINYPWGFAMVHTIFFVSVGLGMGWASWGYKAEAYSKIHSAQMFKKYFSQREVVEEISEEIAKRTQEKQQNWIQRN